MIIPICINLLLGFINKAKPLFASPPKPFPNAVVLKSGFGFFIVVTPSYIGIIMPELGLTMPQWDLSSLLDNIFARNGLVIPTMDIPHMNIVNLSRLANNLSERALQGFNFVPRNWPHHPDYVSLILVHLNNPLVQGLSLGVLYPGCIKLGRFLSSIISHFSCISRSSISDYFKLKIVKFKDTFSKSISRSKYALDKGFLKFNSHLDLLHSLGLNSLFNNVNLKVYSFTNRIIWSYFNENLNEGRFFLHCEDLARSVRSNIIAILELCNNNPGFAVGNLTPSQLERDRPADMSEQDFLRLVDELYTNVLEAEQSLRELRDQIRSLRSDHPEYQTLRSEFHALIYWLSTTLGRSDNLPNGI